ncbi:hypothetical protein ACFC1R_35370 [Kitasatospora sp. NPDC056138]|uniref:hypothetical protein n=1 Tax=Kitasatospora sp. NPDC056138 TaxID=3345724 RepID=UPI0035D66C86
MSYFAVLILPLVPAAVVVVALVVHGRITSQIVRRARREDLPEILKTTSSMMVSVLRVARSREQQPGQRRSATVLPDDGDDAAQLDGVQETSGDGVAERGPEGNRW